MKMYMFNKCFDSTAPDFDVSGFLFLEIGATELNERLKPFPCYCRATARPNSFQLDTANV